MESSLDSKIKLVADMILDSERIVVFTGAGVSTESGIPDFRGPGGIWTRFDPDDFTITKFLYSEETRKKQWRILVGEGFFSDIKPNKAHYAIATLEALGKLDCVITQNIDNLHQEAGNSSDRVFELHGSLKWVRCLDCNALFPIDYAEQMLKDGVEEPPCRKCDGTLKPDVVFFGEALPEHAMQAATLHSSDCDLFIVVGSSLVVQPAALMPRYAKSGRARLVIINIGETPYDYQADVLINESAGDTLERIVTLVKQSMGKTREETSRVRYGSS